MRRVSFERHVGYVVLPDGKGMISFAESGTWRVPHTWLLLDSPEMRELGSAREPRRHPPQLASTERERLVIDAWSG
jgi:hypothetical protein